MAQLQSVLDNLILQFEGYFDIEKPHAYGDRVVLAYAHFTQRMEKYVLVHRSKLYATESNEHVFFVHDRRLDEATWEAEKSFITQAERDYVIPHSEHMYSYMSLVLLCESIDDKVKKLIKRFSFTRNYRFTLHGYSTVRVAALDLSDETIVTNRRGKGMKKVLENALHM
ncbi:MAG: hypothetical protein LBS18_01715 [Clostridiales bacterium]|jgi:hypothetical protein|nr:hypothetical protein [Clostridiales bacterium]